MSAVVGSASEHAQITQLLTAAIATLFAFVTEDLGPVDQRCALMAGPKRFRQ